MSRLTTSIGSLLVLGGLASGPAFASPVAYCIKSCVEDYYPFHDPCVVGCVIADIIWGNSGVDDDRGHLTLTTDPAARSRVELAAGTRDASGGLVLDPDVLSVQFDYALLDEYVAGRPTWRSIGAGAPSSRDSDWKVTWDASRVVAGDYLVRATYVERTASREALMAVTAP